MVSLSGDLVYQGGSIAVVLSRFNGFIGEQLLQGAVDTLKRVGVPETALTVVRVPGAFELPLVSQTLAESGRFAGVLALGVVIRGGTAHFDFVAGECAKGLAHVALKTGVPVAFGVLTTDSIEQAIERAGTKAGNKGADAAMSLIETLNVLKAIRSSTEKR